MSIEIIYYPRNAKKKELVKHLKDNNFYPASHLWNWDKGSVHYHWFEVKDNLSYDGVEATVFPTTSEIKLKYKCSDWALHTRTRVSASPGDLEMQNNVIKSARRKYGGMFFNDSTGTNKYSIVENDNRNAPSRGIYLTYQNVKQQISATKFAIPNQLESFNNFIGTELQSLQELDPTRTLYNALIPFAVASLEYFFGQSFKILLKYDFDARIKIQNQSKKIDLKDVLLINSGEKTVEDIISTWYSFQNINSIHNAFNEWFSIDFWSLIRKRKKIGKRIMFLEDSLNKLIEYRHGVIHRYEIDPTLDKQKIIEIYDLTDTLIEIFVDNLEQSKSMIIRD